VLFWRKRQHLEQDQQRKTFLFLAKKSTKQNEKVEDKLDKSKEIDPHLMYKYFRIDDLLFFHSFFCFAFNIIDYVQFQKNNSKNSE
jgi:hypothetical protein